MSYFKNTNKILILLVAILLASNIATVFTIYLHNKEVHSIDEKWNKNTVEKRKKQHGDFMAKKLNLSPEQVLIFRELRNEFHSESDSVGKLIREKRKLLYIEFAKKEMNVDTLNLISEDIGDLYGELKKYSVKHFISLRNNCTPEQQEKLYGMFKHMFDKEDHFEKSSRNKMKRRAQNNN